MDVEAELGVAAEVDVEAEVCVKPVVDVEDEMDVEAEVALEVELKEVGVTRMVVLDQSEVIWVVNAAPLCEEVV